MNKWVETLNQSAKRCAIPVMTHPGIDLIGKKIKEAVTDGEVQYKAIKAIQDNYPTAAATMMMDLTVEAEAFGCKINFPDDEIPTVAGRLVSDRESIEKLTIPTLESARIPQYLKAAKLAAENIVDKPVLAGCIGPFSLAGRLFDLSEIMTGLYIEPDVIKLLLKKCTKFLLEYVKEMRKAGANGIVMAEPAAGLLSLEMCDEFSSCYIKEIVEEVQRDDFLFVLHNCGNTGQVTQSMVSTGACALHFGNKIDIIEVLKEVPQNILVMGNLDPVNVFKMGKRAEVFRATATLLYQTSGYRNFVISSGCDTPPGVPVENIRAFFEAVDAFN
ncbi:MAG: uroporphyrinogen decarboxylase family protein [Ignavibacteriaceae bacterium]|nr:uroporphyrinogen decarboxylase family protein [Ignavibacteriaceae bacterium]